MAPRDPFLDRTGSGQLAAAYWGALSVSDPDQFVHSTANSILERIRSADSMQLPISLASIATDYLVQAKPILSATLVHGSLNFDGHLHRFVITINKKYALRESGESLFRNVSSRHGPDDDLYLTRRGRFTYAHEFAHRFFYTPDPSGQWVRAIERARAGKSLEVNDSGFLYRREERLCNEFAGRLLVPSRELSERMRRLGWKGNATDADALVRLPETLLQESRAFAVPLSCLFLEARRSLFASGNSWAPQDLCIFLVRDSTQKGIYRHSRTAFRIVNSIFPNMIDGIRLRPLYPGLRIAHLGEELSRHLERVMVSDALGQPVPLTSPVLVEEMPASSSERASKRCLQLSGWCWRDSAEIFGRPLFLWGRLAQ